MQTFDQYILLALNFFLQHFTTFLQVMTTFLQTTTTFLQVSYPTRFRSAFFTPPYKHPFWLYERSYHPPPTRPASNPPGPPPRSVKAVLRLSAAVWGLRYCCVGAAWGRHVGGVEAAWRRRGGGVEAACSGVGAAWRRRGGVVTAR